MTRYIHRRVPNVRTEHGTIDRDGLATYLNNLPADEEVVSVFFVHRDPDGSQVARYEVITRKGREE